MLLMYNGCLRLIICEAQGVNQVVLSTTAFTDSFSRSLRPVHMPGTVSAAKYYHLFLMAAYQGGGGVMTLTDEKMGASLLFTRGSGGASRSIHCLQGVQTPCFPHPLGSCPSCCRLMAACRLFSPVWKGLTLLGVTKITISLLLNRALWSSTEPLPLVFHLPPTPHPTGARP